MKVFGLRSQPLVAHQESSTDIADDMLHFIARSVKCFSWTSSSGCALTTMNMVPQPQFSLGTHGGLWPFVSCPQVPVLAFFDSTPAGPSLALLLRRSASFNFFISVQIFARRWSASAAASFVT